jgi:hypothetical protein
MNIQELDYYYKKFQLGKDNFFELMKHRIKDILLVANFFDAFILEQDGRLSEQIYGEYRQLDLSTAPRISTIPFSENVVDTLAEKEFDLVIIVMRFSQITAHALTTKIKEKFPHLPVVLLLNKHSFIELVNKEEEKMKIFDGIFLWNGDAKLFLAIIKLMEDKKNVSYDTKHGHVRVVLLVENAIDYYSTFIPIFYASAMRLTQELIDSETDIMNKRMRMRTRPKILLAGNYEEAMQIYRQYRDYIICVITNANLQVEGKFEAFGGIDLVSEIRQEQPDIPIMIQSADEFYRKEARKVNAEFCNKYSKTILHDIRNFIINNLGFGDFVFRDSDGVELTRAKSMYEFEQKIAEVPEESILYHGERNHFSAWLMAHGEIQIAHKIRYIVTDDFLSTQDIRKFLIQTIHKVRELQNRGKVVKFDSSIFTENEKITMLAEGSLGGKGRGLSFLNALLVTMDLSNEFENVDIKIPKTAIIGTHEFDIFIEENKIDPVKLSGKTDDEIAAVFMDGTLSGQLQEMLRILLNNTKNPLAVRSSGLLEDSQSQPFAGIYKTFMLPNNNDDFEIRLRDLMNAIKLVFVSPYQSAARQYIESIHFKVEEEKMAVVIQEIVGLRHANDLYFPHLSGAAQSYNFYPAKRIKHSDGIAAIAVGLGKSVVDGERTYRFCPNYPKITLLEPVGIVENNQRDFYGLDLAKKVDVWQDDEDLFLVKKKILNSYKNGVFKEMTSVWDYENLQFLDGKFVEGPRVITFRNQILYERFPLSSILKRVLDIGELAHGVPVEIEFAINLQCEQNSQNAFNLLQIRPLSVHSENIDVDIAKFDPEQVLLYTTKGMGNGIVRGIQDVIYLIPDKFDNTDTLKMAEEIDELNAKLRKEDKKYILIGPGRWGSSDRFLGVPVRWAQIDMVKIIIEASLETFAVEASQGSHFFHNLVAMNVGYFTIPHSSKTDFINWEWLKNQTIVNKTDYFVHISSCYPLEIRIDGRTGRALIMRDSPEKIPQN